MVLSASAWADLAERLPRLLPPQVSLELSAEGRAPLQVGEPLSDATTRSIQAWPGLHLRCAPASAGWLPALVRSLAELVTESESLSRELAATYGKLALLDEFGRVLSTCSDSAAVGRGLAMAVESSVHSPGCLLARDPDGTWSHLAHWGGAGAGKVDMPQVLEHLAQRPLPFLAEHTHPPAAMRVDFAPCAVCAVPLIGPEGIEGLLLLARPQAFASDEAKLVELAAAQCAAYLYKLRQDEVLRRAAVLAHDVALAGRIQLRLLPRRLPALPGYHLAGRLRQASHVGGDWYDALHHGGLLWLVIADVSGHSVPAALAMSMVRAAFRTALPGASGPGALLSLLDRHLTPDLIESTLFVSLVCLALNPLTGEFALANAGHPPVLQRYADGSVLRLDGEGAIIGLLGNGEYPELHGRLAKGETLLLYTDGVTEREDALGRPFGEARLGELLRQAPSEPEALIQTIETHLAALAGKRRDDDTTVLVCTRSTN